MDLQVFKERAAREGGLDRRDADVLIAEVERLNNTVAQKEAAILALSLKAESWETAAHNAKRNVERLTQQTDRLQNEYADKYDAQSKYIDTLIAAKNKAQSSLTRSKAEGRIEGMEDLVCYMIDNCERKTITEEYLQGVLSDCIRFFDIASAVRQQAQEGKE